MLPTITLTLTTPAFSGILVHGEQNDQRACELELLTYCTCAVVRIYLRLATSLFKRRSDVLSTPVVSNL